ncbi:hypothetical protein B0H14DRAFT_3124170 [Mycena olivaceomarginata]|nr:hypothetical protein B0H14DRAFT_3124170 [Mycena olivaceomarginata]
MYSTGKNMKRKKTTTITFSRARPATDAIGSTGAAGPSTTTARVLREKTTIGQDGLDAASQIVSHFRRDIQKEREPIYGSYSAADHGGDEEEEEEGRDLRESDNPLGQWVQDHRQQYLEELLRFEGRGDHAKDTECRRCGKGVPDGGELMCKDCIVAAHRQMPLHKIQKWKGSSFKRKTLKALGLRIQLGHWNTADAVCSVPEPAPNDDFVIVDNTGVHPVHLDYCGCGQGGLHTVQLLRAQLWAATTTRPRTAATFSVLRRYHLLSFESKCAALEFYQSLARETDNLHYKKDKDRYREFVRMTRQWRDIQILKRGGRGHELNGIANTKPGNVHCCARHVLSRKETCRRDGRKRRKQSTLDANFRLKRKDVSTEEKDPGLGNGRAFFCEVTKYMAHVKKHWNLKQERSHCVTHDAVDKPDREARGTASSGIGAVDCARHNMKRPNAVGDLQLGERYINMDYMFWSSIAGSALQRFFVSLLHYGDPTLTIDGTNKYLTFLVPKFHLPAHIEACNLKFSFHLTRDVGQTDGEAPERGWADANPLARSTKEMGPGFRRDTLDDHFNDWNHKKIIALGYTMRRKVEKAVPEMVKTREALADMVESLGSDVVKEWTVMAEKWEADVTAPNPFETIRKDKHLAKVRQELAAEAAEREKAGTEDAGAVKGDMHITELLSMGLQLEELQRVLAFDIAATGLHPTDGQRRAMIELAWIDVQTKFFPALANLREREDRARAARASEGQAVPGVKVSDMALWLPSAIVAAPADAREVVVQPAVLQHEYRLRVGQASEALHEIRRLLLVRTHLYKLKDTHSRESLGRVLKRDEWEWTLQELREDDIRGLPQAQFHDPEHKARKKKRARVKKAPPRPLSWIWITRGERWEAGDDAAMNEAVRIEWSKTRARAMRWAEEVDLLEEEMRRILQFLRWRTGWWTAKVGQRGLPEGPQCEGETAYALRQAEIQSKLADQFTEEWKTLAGLISQGRAGEVDGAEESDEEGEEGASDEEDEPIPTLPARPLKSTYVDEVLVM